jgi:hypothetical protein
MRELKRHISDKGQMRDVAFPARLDVKLFPEFDDCVF